MMSPLIYLAFLLGFVFCDDTIVLPPTKLDSSLPQKLLIFIPGGKVPNQNYTLTAQSIQSSSNLRLWVVIIAPTQRLCIIECGTSFLCSFLHSTIESAVGKAKADGYSGEDSGSDVFLAAHSLGGICANTLMKAYKNPYAGVILMGSTPDENGDYDLLNYPAPILTLNVELDFAQARPGKTSHWFRQFQQLASIKGKNATLAAKPLIVLRGMDHSDFCPGFQVPGDLFSEVTREQALSAIGTTVAAFLHQHTSQNETIVAKSLNILSSLFDSTEELMKPIITALDLEVDGGEGLFHGGAKSTWCQISQHQLSALPPNLDARVIVTDTYQNTTSNLNSCSAAGKVSGTNVLVNSCSLGTYYSDSFNTGNIVAAQQISCKLLSPTQIAKLLATAPSTNSSCLLINKYAVQLAESLVLPRTLQRYQAKGRPIKLLADQVVSSDSDWQSKDLTWTESTQNVEVAALAYITDTEGDCKVLSPARVIDWMMTDSLKSSS